MKAIEWIEKVREAHEDCSYYRAAQMLGISRQSVSNYKTGRTPTLDSVTAQKVEELLNLPAGTVITDQEAEREQNPKVAAVWRHLGKLAIGERGSAVAGALATNCLALFGVVVTYQGVITDGIRNYCILCSIDGIRKRVILAPV